MNESLYPYHYHFVSIYMFLYVFYFLGYIQNKIGDPCLFYESLQRLQRRLVMQDISL